MSIFYAAKLSFVTRNTNVDTQKIDGSALVTCGMAIWHVSRFKIAGKDSVL